MIGIYKIENLVNGKCYIGQSENIEQRWERHQTTLTNPNDKGYNYPLYRAIRKYGQENFSWKILEQCSKEELNTKEKYWVAFYNSFHNGYNQTEGGDSLSPKMKGPKLTENQVKEIKEKLLTQNYTLQKLSEEYNVHRDTIRDINNGWSWIEEGLQYPLYVSYKSPLYEKEKFYCQDCGKEISRNSLRCNDCERQARVKYDIPKKEELENQLISLNGNFTEVGKYYGVTDNQVRRWCKKYEMPFHTKDYKVIVEKPKRTAPIKIRVEQYDLSGNFIQSFESYAEAARWLENNNYVNGNLNGVRAKIGEVCRGKRKTAYKFIWRKSE